MGYALDYVAQADVRIVDKAGEAYARRLRVAIATRRRVLDATPALADHLLHLLL
jgi:hypothetical protein